jgi:uncharacterized membrane protein
MNYEVPMMGLGKTDIKRFVILLVLLFWCTGMVAVRIERTGSGYYRFLLGNLFLASIPLVLSTGLRIADRLALNWTIKAGVFCLWLLFLPNAPYILTDILHLTRANQAPAWFDLALLLSCSGTGLLMGYLSLIDVQTIVARHYSVVMGWLFAIVSLVLSGFAIYLGRFLRWNSWDVLTTPTLIFQIADGLTHPTLHVGSLSVTFVFGIILALGYISLRVLLDSSIAPSKERS